MTALEGRGGGNNICVRAGSGLYPYSTFPECWYILGFESMIGGDMGEGCGVQLEMNGLLWY